MLGAVKSAPISIAFQAAVTHLEVAMPFIDRVENVGVRVTP